MNALRKRCSGSLVVVILLVSRAALGADEGPKYGPKTAPRAVPLSQDHAYLRSGAAAPDFWALMPYYVPQTNDASCSAASVAMVVNAAVRAGKVLGNEDRNITEADLLDRVDLEHWKARLGLLGYFGRHGLSLAQLNAVTTAALHIFGSSRATTEVAAADGTPEGLARFRAALAANEKSAGDTILVHFIQDGVTAAPGGPYPHISPIGAYDAATHRVLVLDVDRKWYEPYWVADEVLFAAMSVSTSWFGSGGWIRASFDAEQAGSPAQ
jgi:hypothetical protein